MLFVIAGVCNAALNWEYDSPLTVTETITDIGGGDYKYEYSFENVDTSTIWNFLLYTEFVAQGQSTFDSYDVWTAPSAIEADSLPDYYDPSILDSDILYGLGSAYEYWSPQYGEDYGIQINQIATGFSFTSSVYNNTPKYYIYCTVASGRPSWNGTGNVAAVGTTVPEPMTISLFGLGALALFKRRK
jgi:hypothetical protein